MHNTYIVKCKGKFLKEIQNLLPTIAMEMHASYNNYYCACGIRNFCMHSCALPMLIIKIFLS